MKPKYCQYCGETFENGCDCLRDLSNAKEEWMEDYYNSPETQAGWRNEDLIIYGHFNQR